MKEFLNNIANLALIKSNTCKDYGLYQGTLGACLFLYNYGRKAGIETYCEYAQTLLDTLLTKNDDVEESNISCGYCGIGIGLNYLKKNLYYSNNKEKIEQALSYTDNKVFNMPTKPYLSDIRLKESLWSVGLYVLARFDNWTDKDRQLGKHSLESNVKLALEHFCNEKNLERRRRFLQCMNYVLQTLSKRHRDDDIYSINKEFQSAIDKDTFKNNPNTNEREVESDFVKTIILDTTFILNKKDSYEHYGNTVWQKYTTSNVSMGELMQVGLLLTNSYC